MGGETISNCDASKLGRLSYESTEVLVWPALNPFRGGEPGIKGDRTRGGEETEGCEDILGRPVPLLWRLELRACCAYCSGSAGLGGMSPSDALDPMDSELRTAPAAMSRTLGRRFFVVGSRGCSLLDREPVEEIEPLLDPVEKLPLLHDLRIDLRAPDFSVPGSGEDGGSCEKLDGGERCACCDTGRLAGTGGGDGERIAGGLLIEG